MKRRYRPIAPNTQCCDFCDKPATCMDTHTGEWKCDACKNATPVKEKLLAAVLSQ